MKNMAKLVSGGIVVIISFLLLTSAIRINNAGPLLPVAPSGLVLPSDLGSNTYPLQGNWSQQSCSSPGRDLKCTVYGLRLLAKQKNRLGLLALNFAPAFSISINGHIVGEVGEAKTDEFQPGYTPLSVEIDSGLYQQEGENYVLDIRVMAMGYGKEPNVEKLLIGSPEAIQRDHGVTVALNLFAAGIFLALALYSFSLLAGARKEEYLLYLGIVAAVSLTKSLVGSEAAVISYLYPFNYTLASKLDMATALANTLFLLLLYQKLFPSEGIAPRLCRLTVGVGLTLIAAVLFADLPHSLWIYGHTASFFFRLVGAMVAFVNIGALYRSRRGALPLLAGFLVFAGFTRFQTLVALGVLPYGPIAKYIEMDQYGCLAFVMTLSAVLAYHYGAKFTEAGEMTKKLEHVNNNLEQIVEEKTARLRLYATFDAMTNVYNRRAGLEKLSEQFSEAKASGYALTICFVDVDELKTVNDALGHERGDQLIITAVDAIKAHIRSTDFIVRLGGDEFLICLPRTTEAEAELVWKRISLHAGREAEQGTWPFPISMSHGTVAFDPESHASVDEIIRQADRRMYLEKRGRQSLQA